MQLVTETSKLNFQTSRRNSPVISDSSCPAGVASINLLRSLNELSERKCRFCATAIPAAARVCPHCRRDLVPSASRAPTPVHVTSSDPFGHLHASIQGKSTGSLTVVGHLGVGLGVLMVLVAGLALTGGPRNAEGAFVLALLGVGVSVASYLWVRR